MKIKIESRHLDMGFPHEGKTTTYREMFRKVLTIAFEEGEGISGKFIDDIWGYAPIDGMITHELISPDWTYDEYASVLRRMIKLL